MTMILEYVEANTLNLFVTFVSFAAGLLVAACMHNRKDTIALGVGMLLSAAIPVVWELSTRVLPA